MKAKAIKEKLKKLTPFFIILVLPFIFFYKTLNGQYVITVGDFSGSDLIDLHLPFKQILHNNISQGKLPLWETDLSLGFPVISEGQSGPFYPLHILFALLPAQIGLNLSIISTFILAGLFAFIYARSIGLKPFSALVSATTFAFSAFFITRVKHVNMIAVAAWVPFLFWSTKKLFQKKNLFYAILCGLGIAIQFLIGHPQMAFFSLFIFLIYFVFEFSLSTKKKGLDNSLPTASSSLLIIALIGAGLSAIQTLPTLELTQLTERSEYTLQTATAYPFHLKNLLTFISPYYFGNPALGTYSENIRISGIFWENASYIGFLPLILAVWTILSTVKSKSRSTYNLFFTSIALFSLILMLGQSTPIFEALWSFIPGFQLFRFPTRFNLFLILSLSLLAGQGAHFLVKKLKSLSTPKVGKKASEVGFTWPLATVPTQSLIFIVILLDLFVFGSSYIAYFPSEKLLKTPEPVKKIQEDQDMFRIYSLTQYGPNPYSAIGWKRDQEAILQIREAIPPNNNVFYNLSSFTDRAWFEGGLGIERRNRLENYLLNENQSTILIGKLLGMFNVKYILSFSEALGIEIDKIEEYDLGEQFATPLNLFENKQFMPRIFFTPQAEVIKDEKAIFDRMADLEFNPTTTVILEKEPQTPPAQFAGAIDLFREENPIEITDYQDNRVLINANISKHGFLVLSDIYYPGWKVEVDGNQQEILKANYLVRAIELQPGEHEVRFYYDPLSFKIGSRISLATLVTIILSSVFLSLKLVFKKSIAHIRKYRKRK